jgi:hypothetical protein
MTNPLVYTQLNDKHFRFLRHYFEMEVLPSVRVSYMARSCQLAANEYIMGVQVGWGDSVKQ